MIKKILYIEDEPDAEVIVNIFESVLTEEEIQALKESENDEDAIFEAIRTNKRLEITSCFTEAIYRLNSRLDEYELLIVDRNLYGDGTNYKREIIPTDLHPQFEDSFIEWEGDFLLALVFCKNYDIDNKFFMLTGYEEPITEVKELKKMLTPNFRHNNILFKETNGTEKIKDVVESSVTRLNINYLDILQNYIDDHGYCAKVFLKILEEKDVESRIGDNLKEIRIVYESIFKECLVRIPNMKENCIDANGRLKHAWLKWGEENQHMNTIQTNFFNTIFFICSRFGAHPDPSIKIYPPSLDTVNSLVFALKDIILWFGNICEKYPRKK